MTSGGQTPEAEPTMALQEGRILHQSSAWLCLAPKLGQEDEIALTSFLSHFARTALSSLNGWTFKHNSSNYRSPDRARGKSFFC